MANKKTTQADMAARGLAKKSGKPKPDASVDLMLEHFARHVDRRTKAGKALWTMLLGIRDRGLSPRLLQALETARLTQLEQHHEQGLIETPKMHVQVGKIIDSLRRLIEADIQTDKTVPGQIVIKVQAPTILGQDLGAGDPIVLRSVQDALAQVREK